MRVRYKLGNSTLTIAIVTDIHHGPDRGTKKGTTALPLLDKFCRFVSDLSPHCTVEMGDRISEVDEATDRKLMSEVAAALARIPGKRHHIIGNHDVAKLTIVDNEELMQRSFASYSTDIQGFHLVFWNVCAKLQAAHGFSLSPSDLDWLRADLNSTNLPALVITHIPLNNGSMKGNFYFEKAYPQFAAYPEPQGDAVRAVLERSGKVILCVNGHAHWNAYHCIDGIHYVTIPSLTESCTTWPHPNEAFAALRLKKSIEIEVFGRTPMLYRLPIRQAGEHWVNIHKDYSPAKIKPQ